MGGNDRKRFSGITFELGGKPPKTPYATSTHFYS